jgi:hypothetical protein
MPTLFVDKGDVHSVGMGLAGGILSASIMAWKKTEEVFMTITGTRFVCANADVTHTKPTAKLLTMEVKKRMLVHLWET